MSVSGLYMDPYTDMHMQTHMHVLSTQAQHIYTQSIFEGWE